MLCISSQLQHMDPVTLTEPLLLWEGFSYPKWKRSLHFFFSSFQTEHDSQGAGEHGKAEEFPSSNMAGIYLWTMDRNEKRALPRNSQLPQIPGTHLSSQTFFKRRNIHSDACPFAHMQKTVISPSRHQSNPGQRKPRLSGNSTLDVFHWSTMADYSPPNAKPWIIRFNNREWKFCSKSQTPSLHFLWPFPFLGYSSSHCSQ